MIKWVSLPVVLAVHDAQIAEHGGLDGIRDMNALESAIARPQNILAYSNPEPDLAALAAAYAFAIANNHAFIDGNKRTSEVVTRTFLILNGCDLDATDAEKVQVWSDLGAEAALADWLRERMIKRKRRRG